MISEGCDTEEWSNDTENSALIMGINIYIYIYIYIHIIVYIFKYIIYKQIYVPVAQW